MDPKRRIKGDCSDKRELKGLFRVGARRSVPPWEILSSRNERVRAGQDKRSLGSVEVARPAVRTHF